MHNRPTARPLTTITTRSPQAPLPDPRTIFLEAHYADGLPYDTTADAPDEENDLEAAA
ncbi:hypothetical protein [Streptomyces sp. DSM 41534]